MKEHPVLKKIAKLIGGMGLVAMTCVLIKFDQILTQTKVPYARPSLAVKTPQILEDLWPRDDSFYFIESSGRTRIHSRHSFGTILLEKPEKPSAKYSICRLVKRAFQSQSST